MYITLYFSFSLSHFLPLYFSLCSPFSILLSVSFTFSFSFYYSFLFAHACMFVYVYIQVHTYKYRGRSWKVYNDYEEMMLELWILIVNINNYITVVYAIWLLTVLRSLLLLPVVSSLNIAWYRLAFTYLQKECLNLTWRVMLWLTQQSKVLAAEFRMWRQIFKDYPRSGHPVVAQQNET